ncbi:hypothetical protein [Rhodococcoides fascians]|nr:hypothetical protein [Rhodococcus fascians]
MTPGDTDPLGMIAVLTMIVMAIVLFARRRHIEPVDVSSATRPHP